MLTSYFHRMTNLDDPHDRCEGISQIQGSCPFKKVPGRKYCPRHGGTRGLRVDAKEAVKNYRLFRWKKRVGELAESEGVKSLREEVGILRMILEEMLNNCKDSMDLLLYSHKMSDLVMKIEKLVVSCDRLENRMGLLLSKGSILQLAQQYVEIISENVNDPEIIERISTRMIQVTASISNPIAE